MILVKGGLGMLALLIGLVWIGQGLNLILGSPMTGHPQFSVLGLIVVGIGVWMLWSAVRSRITLRAG